MLWPEHFDVAATEDEVNYGVSAGDAPRDAVRLRRPMAGAHGPFWNAPFGALYPLSRADDVDGLTSRIADFFERGRRQLQTDRSAQ